MGKEFFAMSGGSVGSGSAAEGVALAAPALTEDGAFLPGVHRGTAHSVRVAKVSKRKIRRAARKSHSRIGVTPDASGFRQA